MIHADRNAEATALIAELPLWNSGSGIDAEGWIGCTGNTELAIGYSLLFWPGFARTDGYVVRAGCSDSAYLENWKQQCGGDRASVERVVNHIHIADLHAHGTNITEPQARYLGRLLKNIYEVKLRSDFPDLSFEVFFNDEPGLELIDYEMTFWQT